MVGAINKGNVMSLPTNIRKQIESAYRTMAEEGRYRPAAPSDGLGNLAVPVEELDLQAESAQYAEEWWAEEDSQSFDIGCCNHDTRPATIFAIEAARNLCAGTSGNAAALRLLKLAVKDLEAYKKRKGRGCAELANNL
jgi:hypothetical protein